MSFKKYNNAEMKKKFHSTKCEEDVQLKLSWSSIVGHLNANLFLLSVVSFHSGHIGLLITFFDKQESSLEGISFLIYLRFELEDGGCIYLVKFQPREVTLNSIYHKFVFVRF